VAEAESIARSPADQTKAGGNTWVVLTVVLLLGCQAAWWFWWHDRSEGNRGNGSRVHSVLHLETFVLNLVDPEGKAYLRVGIDLGLKGPAQTGEHDQDGVTPVAMVRDTILGRLSLAKPDELLTSEGKAKLKADLLQALQQRAPELGVEEIYFTEFLIQR